MKRNAIAFGSIAAIAAVAVLLFMLLQTGWSVESLFSWARPKANTVYNKNSYTVSNWKASAFYLFIWLCWVLVATCRSSDLCCSMWDL